MANNLRIGLAQFNFCVGDIEGNTKRIIDSAKLSKQKSGVDVMVFPELAITGYPPEDLLLRPEFHRLVENAIAEIVNQSQNCSLSFGTAAPCLHKLFLLDYFQRLCPCLKFSLSFLG